ncbi:MAG: N-acetyl-alpha-D-glucosaminyl L-malate synthase BshA [Acidobacteriota bacterium]
MRIGIVCYASLGGSGIVATELARHLVARGHEVHLLSSDIPFRLQSDPAGIILHRVETPSYPLFHEPQYLLSLATLIVQVVRERRLDIVHAHYAVPHATAAWLAREILTVRHDVEPPRIITTLHGTDITLIGSDPSYTEAVSFSIDHSDAVTAVSHSLRESTCTAMPVHTDVRVIYNFLDCAQFDRRFDPELRRQLSPGGEDEALIVHMSNFRPVKRLDAVMEIFRRIRQHTKARLVLAGDGPDAVHVPFWADAYGLRDELTVLPPQQSVVPLLSVADLFLLPSLQESFGLAALEAMACEVPVVVSRVGGLPEVVEHDVTGFLHPPEDLVSMAASAVAILKDPERRRRMGQAARRAVVARFCAGDIVPQYEALYRELAG